MLHVEENGNLRAFTSYEHEALGCLNQADYQLLRVRVFRPNMISQSWLIQHDPAAGMIRVDSLW